jgi:hypothetical protein
MATFTPQMSPGFTAEQTQKIIEALNKKLKGFCPGCSLARTFQLVTDGIVYMPVHAPPAILGIAATLYSNTPTTYPSAYLGFPKGNLPCVALVCTNCGFLQFHNLVALGLGGLIGMPMVSGVGGI